MDIGNVISDKYLYWTDPHRHFINRDIADSLLRRLGSSLTPWWHQPSSGAAASPQLTGRDKLVKEASGVPGCPLDTLELVGDGRMDNTSSHPMRTLLQLLQPPAIQVILSLYMLLWILDFFYDVFFFTVYYFDHFFFYYVSCSFLL